MKKIIIILLLAFPFITEAQVFKKLQVQRLKSDTLLLYKVLPSNSDTCLIIKHDTVYWRLCSSINVDTSFFSHVSDTALTIQGWDTTSIINYIAALPAANGYWDSTANVIHPTDTTNAVAIGTNSAPAGTMLRINDGSVLFDGSTGTTPVSGAGTRMMWIPAKYAIRIGRAIAAPSRWDDANIGAGSFALTDALASGIGSFALYESLATGNYSIASGQSTASGTYAVALGGSSTASGTNSAMAFGNVVTASGNRSFASGYITTASGDNSNASGYKSLASGISSFAIGDSSRAMGKASFAGGRAKAYGAYSFAFGDSINAQAAHSAAFGFGNLVRGNKTAWITTDDLFVIGNGKAAKNNALTILKNGTAYIGDASSTTDPILTVSTTDSTTTLIGILKLTPQDDPPVSASEGMIYADTDHHLYYYNGTAWVQLD